MSRSLSARFRPTLIACATVAAVAAPLAHAVTRDGTEFRVHTVTAGDQSQPSAATAPDGSYVVAWTGSDGSSNGIRAQRFDAAGAPAGSEFVVNTTTEFDQSQPAVAMAADGSFVVTWEGQLGGGRSSFARRFDATGAGIGTDFTVDATPSSTQMAPAIAMNGSGAFVIAWTGTDASDFGVFAQRFNAAGVRQGSEFQVNTYTSFFQLSPAVAMDAAGGFLVAWESEHQDGAQYGIYGQRYDSAGGVVGSEFLVNETTATSQRNAAIAMAADGSFTAAWTSNDQDGNLGGVYARRFDTTASPLAGEFRANAQTFGDQRNPAISVDSAGGFAVAWTGSLQDETGNGVFGRRYDGTGAADGGEFRINTYGNGNQSVPAVVGLPAGEFLVAWQSDGQDGDAFGVYAQRFEQDAHGGAPVLIISGTTSVTEGNAATYTAHLSDAPASDASARVRIDGTATAGTDYTAPPSVVTLPAGLTDTPLASIPVAADCGREVESLNINAAQPADGSIALGEPSRVTLTILDPRVGMVSTGDSILEGGSRKVNVVLSAALPCNLTIRYGLSGGTAKLDTDYTASTPRIVVMPAGTTTFELVQLSTIDDALVEPNETVIVTLRIIGKGARLDAAAATYTLTVRNND